MNAPVFVVVTDGRTEMIDRVMPQVYNLAQDYNIIINDDSGDSHYRRWLQLKFSDRCAIMSAINRQGFSGAYTTIWSTLATLSNDYAVIIEDDFDLLDFPIGDMITVLDNNPQLAQLALLRNPISEDEMARGSVYDNNFYQRNTQGIDWIEHQQFYTTNPHIVPLNIVKHYAWPNESDSENKYSATLFSDDYTCGYYGKLDDKERVIHNGFYRKGTGY